MQLGFYTHTFTEVWGIGQYLHIGTGSAFLLYIYMMQNKFEFLNVFIDVFVDNLTGF
jgi:hypothetical protein